MPTDAAPDFHVEGGCACGAVRFRVTRAPLFVHCCHCTWCQRETGSAFAVNALVETRHVALSAGRPERIDTPTRSGRGQAILRCPDCRVALWSHYAGHGDAVAFVRVGTLDPPHGVAPTIHIYTETKQPWVALPDGVPAVPAYYARADFWPAESLQRWRALAGA